MVSEKAESPSSVQEEEREVVRECSNRHFENTSTGSGDMHTHLPSRTLALCMLRRCSILYRTILCVRDYRCRVGGPYYEHCKGCMLSKVSRVVYIL